MKSAEEGGREFDELKRRSWKEEEEMRLMDCDKVTMTNQNCFMGELFYFIIEQMGETNIFYILCSILPFVPFLPLFSSTFFGRKQEPSPLFWAN
jgi:hypothetical protein